MQMQPYKIIILDDHSVIGEGVRFSLKGDKRFFVLETFYSPILALSFIKEDLPDVLILDIDIPEMDGLTVLQQIKKGFPSIKVIIFTMHESLHYFTEAKKIGIDGYVLKSEPITMMPTIIMQAMKGDVYISDHLKRYGDIELKKNTLNELQFNIVMLLSDGLCYSEIAQKLGKSTRTIDYHISKLKQKLNLNNNVELINYIHKNYLK